MARDIVDVSTLVKCMGRTKLTLCTSDEADVFLDSRGSKGEVFPQQNAMVSGMPANAITLCRC
jgi:hypothetical protein